jgi:hypothetical protein
LSNGYQTLGAERSLCIDIQRLPLSPTTFQWKLTSNTQLVTKLSLPCTKTSQVSSIHGYFELFTSSKFAEHFCYRTGFDASLKKLVQFLAACVKLKVFFYELETKKACFSH